MGEVLGGGALEEGFGEAGEVRSQEFGEDHAAIKLGAVALGAVR